MTKKILEEICKKIDEHMQIIGMVVFLNRLPLYLTRDLKDESFNLWSFYNWPSPPFKDEEFPYSLEE